jgi:hypothetical protein
VRKAKLLSTVAAALLLTAGGALAQGMSKDTPERAPAAQQGAPAEKVAPSMKEGEKAHPSLKQGEKAQVTPDAKSGKARETTGQAPKSDEKAGQTMDKMDNKSGSAASGKSDTDVRSKSEQNAQTPKSSTSPSTTSQSTTEQNRNATTGQGAAGSAKLTTEQRTKITTAFKQHKVESTHLNVSISVGTRIPTNVHLYPLPAEVITIYPDWRGYEYILVGDQIVIINPRTHEIVAVVEA